MGGRSAGAAAAGPRHRPGDWRPAPLPIASHLSQVCLLRMMAFVRALPAKLAAGI